MCESEAIYSCYDFQFQEWGSQYTLPLNNNMQYPIKHLAGSGSISTELLVINHFFQNIFSKKWKIFCSKMGIELIEKKICTLSQRTSGDFFFI